MKNTFIFTKIGILASFLLLSSLSISQEESWVDIVEWKTFEAFKKNKQKQISFIYIEGEKELKKQRRVNNKKVQEILNNFNCTKLKITNQDFSFKGQNFQKEDGTQIHQFEDYLVGNSIDQKYNGPVIVILDKDFNFIEFKFIEFSQEEIEINKVLLEAENIKLDFLKENIKSKDNKEIQKQELILERLIKSNQRNSESKSVFNAMRYNNYQLEHLLNYFSNKQNIKGSLRNYIQTESKKNTN